MTRAQKAVLSLLEAVGEPIGAYEIDHRLSAATRRKWAGNTVYRALDTLTREGQVLRVATLRKYVMVAADISAPVALICQQCGRVEVIDSPALHSSVEIAAESKGLRARHKFVETTGICKRCQCALAV